MSDCISRQAVIDELNKWEWQELYLPIHFKENIIDVVPSVYPQEPKTGHWIEHNDDHYDWYECSECGYGAEGEITSESGVRFNYCPNCGVRMEKQE